MARAETIEHVGETGGGGNSPLPRHGNCHMELPGPFNTWPGLLTTTTATTTVTPGSGTGTGAIRQLHRNQPHLRPLQPFCLPSPVPSPHSEGQDGPRTHQRLSPSSPSSTPPPLPPCNQREERSRGTAQPSAFSGEQSDSDREEHQEASRQRGPLPDLLPQNEHQSWASQHHGATGGEAEEQQELEVRRLADQLRVIGDEFNTTVLRRAHAGPHWQDWRDVWRGLLNFIDQTLSTLYRLT